MKVIPSFTINNNTKSILAAAKTLE